MSRILVTGRAGYIGSHTVKALLRAGHEPVVLDDFSAGHRQAVPSPVEVVAGRIHDQAVLRKILGGVDAVIHFAAHCYVGVSVGRPRQYYDNNVVGTLSLLQALVANHVRPVLFSSSCAVYGEPAGEELVEERPFAPINPYGRTKAVMEWALQDLHAAGEIDYMALRYFNAAGADPEGELGEDHDPETHLIPLVIDAALRTREPVTVFGTDYDTPDGTCVRDYIHVADLADAHVRGIGHLLDGGASLALNLGTGTGISVREVVAAVARRSGGEVPHSFGDRRPGDPGSLVARPGRAREVLGWTPRHSSLDEIVDTAWTWREAHPEGYGR
jgi:UDP-glucose-4-epimerase GalE